MGNYLGDHMNNFWGVWVTVIVVLNLIGYYLLLIGNSRLSEEESKQETTGHTFDGIVERNEPLPRWWYYMYIGTLVFAAGYLILYPGLGRYTGLLGWSSDKQWEQEVKQMDNITLPLFEEMAKEPIEELAKNDEALAVGGRLFGNHCAICHGSDARGAKGYPDLTDDDWLYGGEPEKIVESITQGRNGFMPPQVDAIGGTDQDVEDMVLYVQSLSRPDLVKTDAQKASVERAEPKFKTVCAACHQADGTGNQMLGAPNLTDNIWLYGPRAEDIEHAIRNGLQGEMPAHKDILPKERIHVLAAYVYSLSQSEE
mgnify:CR=1 FL=1